MAGKTEQDVYAKLGLDWMPRSCAGLVEKSRWRAYPSAHLVELKDIRGDLGYTKATDA